MLSSSDTYAVLLPKTNHKFIVTTIIIVVALHGLVGMGLINMPTMAIKTPKVQPPLQISFLQATKPIEQSKINELPIKVKPNSKPIEKLMSQQSEHNKPKTQSTPTPKVELTTKPKLPIKSDTKIGQIEQPSKKLPRQAYIEKNPNIEVKKPSFIQENTDKAIDTKPITTNTTISQLDTQAALAYQANEAERIAQQKSQQDKIAEKNRLAEQQRQLQEQLAQQAKQRADENARLAKEKADMEKAQKAKADKEMAEQNEQVQSNQPVNFGASDAKWKTRPNTNLPGNLKHIVIDENISSISVRLNVSANGSVTSVAITQSSGNRQIDNFIKQRLQSAKFYPFTRNGVAVAGVGNLTIIID